MLPELRNIRSFFPFEYIQDASAVQLQFMQSIKNIKIWVYSQSVNSAYVSYFSPAYFTVILDNGVSIKIYQNGTFQNSTDIDTQNSFVEFSNPVTGTASCHLNLLPQVICCIPEGLHIQIGKNSVESTAQEADNIETLIDWDQPTVQFIQGYNFQPSTADNIILLTAGANLGCGNLTAFQMRNLLQDGEAESDSYYAGLRSINGITSDLQIATSESIFMQTATRMTQTGLHEILTLKRKESL